MALTKEKQDFRNQQIASCITEIGKALITKEFDPEKNKTAYNKLLNEVSKLVDQHIMKNYDDIQSCEKDRHSKLQTLHSSVVTPIVMSTINQFKQHKNPYLNLYEDIANSENKEKAQARLEKKVLKAIENKPTRSSKVYTGFKMLSSLCLTTTMAVPLAALYISSPFSLIVGMMIFSLACATEISYFSRAHMNHNNEIAESEVRIIERQPARVAEAKALENLLKANINVALQTSINTETDKSGDISNNIDVALQASTDVAQDKGSDSKHQDRLIAAMTQQKPSTLSIARS